MGLKLCSNEIFWPKNALAKYFWNVLKIRSNEIRTNEIRIRREPTVLLIHRTKNSSTRMRMQSSPALSLKFTFCFAFFRKGIWICPTHNHICCCLKISLGQNWKSFRWNCLIKDSKSPFSPLLYPIQVAFLYSFYCCCVVQFVCAQEHLNFQVHLWSCRLDKSTILKRRKSWFSGFSCIHRHFIQTVFNDL